MSREIMMRGTPRGPLQSQRRLRAQGVHTQSAVPVQPAGPTINSGTEVSLPYGLGPKGACRARVLRASVLTVPSHGRVLGWKS